MRRIVIPCALLILIAVGIWAVLRTRSDEPIRADPPPTPPVQNGQGGELLDSSPTPGPQTTFAEPCQEPQGEAPGRRVVNAMVAALSQSSLENYRSCLHPQTAEVPQYGSEEAMRFWQKQFVDLKAGGFEGDWRFEEVHEAEASPRLPAGSLKAYPVVGDRKIGEYLLLVLVDGEWRVLRLFS
jgi:hypothetical protein